MNPMTELGKRIIVALRLALLPMALGALVSCNTDKLLEVDAPTRIPAENLESPASAALLVNGALGDFECALGMHIVTGAILGDEMADAQLGAAGWPLDRRDMATGDAYGTSGCGSNQTPGSYISVSVARWAADNMLTKLQAWTDQEVVRRDSLLALAANLAGFSLTMLATDFCSAALDLGPEVQPAALFALAEQRFTTALDAATRANTQTLLNAARVGRARVRLFTNKKTEAAADARAVPAGFAWNASAASVNTRRQNRVFAVNNFSRFYTIEPLSRTLMTAGVADPRTAVISTSGNRAADGTQLWEQTKFRALTDAIPIASSDEAQLIVAEAEGGSSAVTILNALRTRASLPALSAAETATLQQTLIEERRKELWMEGHRMYDIIRFNIPQLPAAGTAFVRGGFYGNIKCLPLPDIERFNNPSIGR
ncbi:MAG: RagB/SusD family nutrient uptake outer membrane protein [Longimicrobiales bacterium]